MAIYHLHHGFVSRSTGRSSVQSAAYIAAEKLHEDRRNKNVDYSNRSKNVALVKTLYPEHSKYKDISVWNEIENFEDKYAEQHFKSEDTREKYKSSVQTAQTIVLALPNELCIKTNEELLEKFINTRFTSRGLITTYAIHSSEGNLHAHLQISRRGIDENGEFLERKDREICTRSALLETRKLWADLANECLAREGFNERITEKKFEDLGIDLEATKHVGWYAESVGTDSRIAQENLEIARRNEEKILGEPNIILDYLNEKKAVFTQKDILSEIGKRVFDTHKISCVFEKALEEAVYVGESINGEFLYTGARYQQLESDVMSKFEDLSSRISQTICNQETQNEVLSKFDYLSAEQKSAVVGLTGKSNFGILVGKAGSGKTTAMQAISEIYEQSGSRVIGMSLSAVASENLGKDAGIKSATIASWAHKWRVYETAQEKFLSFNSIVTDGVLKQLDWYNDLKRYEVAQLKSGDVIVVDEAGMVGTADWEVILDAAEKFGAKVIAVGDDNQFKSISAGDCLRHFIDQKQDGVLELSDIRRQKESWQREASVEFSKLNVGEALAKYERHGKLHEVDGDQIYSRISEKYIDLEQIGTTAVLCSTNKECNTVNDAVRALKKAKGELGNDLIKIDGRSFSENEKIIFLENNKQFDVKNAQLGTVKSFNEGVLSIETDSGIKNIDTREYDKINHGYAITLHKSQGKTYDNTIVLANKMMDAKAFYVGMTRHRENVDLYYKKTDFGSFKDLANSASKYSHKDSLEDYRNIENQNKARVFEYKETLLETASVLKDINKGEADWKEYHALKSNSIGLGKEILSNYDVHKIYLDQLGITKEKLEIGVGLKQRPLSNVELNAKSTVDLYAKSSHEVRSLFSEMKKECFNVTKHVNYEQYCGIRELRNDLAKEILSNYPLHREFVREASRDFFISKKSMENQVNYADRAKSGTAKISDYEIRAQQRDLRANTEVAVYVGLHNKVQSMQSEMLKSESDITKHGNYAEYQKLLIARDEQGSRILEDLDSHKNALAKYEPQGISKQLLEWQSKYHGRINEISDEKFTTAEDMKSRIGEMLSSTTREPSADKPQMAASSDLKSAEFLQKISEMKIFKEENEFEKLISLSTPKEFIESEKKDSLYMLSSEIHKKTEGYALHASNSMLNNYLSSHGIEMQSQEHIYKYASILVQKAIDEQKLKEVPTELIESSIKQAVCFEVLKQATSNKELTPESVTVLHSKAQILSEKLTNDNIRVLNNKELMKEANAVIQTDDVSSKSLPIAKTEQIVMAHESDVAYERSKEISPIKELEKSKEFELSI